MSTEDTMSPTERLAAMRERDAAWGAQTPDQHEELWSRERLAEAYFDACYDRHVLLLAATPRLTPAPSPDALRRATDRRPHGYDRSRQKRDGRTPCFCGRDFPDRAALEAHIADEAARAALATPAEPPAAPPTLDAAAIEALDMALRYSRMDHDTGCAKEGPDGWLAECSCPAAEYRKRANAVVKALGTPYRKPNGDYPRDRPLDVERLAVALDRVPFDSEMTQRDLAAFIAAEYDRLLRDRP